MLRSRIPDKYSEVEMPVLGVNLRDPQHQLQPGECCELKNAYYDGSIRPIPGTTRLTASALQASKRITGGHRFYRRDGAKKRLVSYSTRICEISDAGVETVLTSIASDDRHTLFSTWPITNRAYAANGVDNPYYYDGGTFAQLSGTNIPTPLTRLVPVLDRLMVGTAEGIERTNARSDSVWSQNNSWATKRFIKPGLPTALHPFSVRGTDAIYPGALAFQANAFYIITGTDFGSDVTSVTPSASEDSSIQLLDGTVGTSSPMSVCTVPSVGIFWVTSDLNVYLLPEGSLKGIFVGDKIQSRTTTIGLGDANKAAIDQIWMEYFDRKLILGFPSGSSTYPNVQYWLDLRYLTGGDPKGSVWYGPQMVNTWGCAWREDQGGELKLMAGEGNAATGAYLYEGYQAGSIAHTVGPSTTLPMMTYRPRYNGYDGGTSMKYVPNARFTMTMTGGTAKAGMVGMTDAVVFRQPVSAFNE